ncbi:MAG: redoxin family protein [Phycisphaerales bacterium]|nr:redoxin family protein [Phycisphaerales bacterium]
MRKLIAGLVASLVCVGTAAAQKDSEVTLMIGDKAPRLEHVEWIQGGPVSSWESGHIYVLDFWATWCGPCVAAIPHMNELYKEHTKDNVHVVGVAIWPNARMTPTDEFVSEKGGAMAYTIGADIDAKTSEAFMTAAGQNGIPTVMIVNQEGRIAWIGHPMAGMDEALESILAGEYDIKAAAEKHRKRIAMEGKVNELVKKMRQGMSSENWDQAIEAIDGLMALDEEQFSGYATQKYIIMATGLKDKTRASKYGREIVKGQMWDNSNMLNSIAWGIVDPEGQFEEDDMDLDLAMMAAKRANDLTKGEDAFILDTLARVYFRTGNVEKAIDLQKEAVNRADDRMKDSLRAALEEYKEAMSTF